MALAVGVSVAVANRFLDLFGTASQTGWATVYLGLNTAIPGAAGTNGASTETSRKLLAWNASASGAKTASGSPVASWPAWAAVSQTITHVSLWDAAAAGNFLGSIALGTSKLVNATDTLNITSLSLSISTIATT